MTAMFSDNDRAVVAKLGARCLDEELHKPRPFGVKAGGVPQGTWFFAFKGGTPEDTARQLTEMINRGGKP
jgi:hypothetical protein